MMPPAAMWQQQPLQPQMWGQQQHVYLYSKVSFYLLNTVQQFHPTAQPRVSQVPAANTTEIADPTT